MIADPDPCREASPQEPLPKDTLGYDVNENTNKNNQCYLNEVKNRAFIFYEFIIYFRQKTELKYIKSLNLVQIITVINLEQNTFMGL